jgi:hypothetical protein
MDKTVASLSRPGHLYTMSLTADGWEHVGDKCEAAKVGRACRHQKIANREMLDEAILESNMVPAGELPRLLRRSYTESED